ncbi:cytochrome PufQ [Sulfitobacter aestuariivivens]|uniref:Protein pufQ n=1 Tax=Sulfitobacter aestuariivivens TaxID=2766981 RepID=A0A927D8A4_9RHOB|nr:cytochrome PufQ [Sulfitobacter aestuariivivens]MBD3665052.1 protein pufQ [Sulfitobacter aestuariivivens]
MTDISHQIDMEMDTPRARRRQDAHRREYIVYFAVIFIATLPMAFLTWGLKAARQMRLPKKGPIKSAWSQAGIITPMIFTA